MAVSGMDCLLVAGGSGLLGALKGGDGWLCRGLLFRVLSGLVGGCLLLTAAVVPACTPGLVFFRWLRQAWVVCEAGWGG